MLRLIAISGLCLGLMTGCATTTKLMSLGGGESPMQQVLKAQPEISKEHQNITRFVPRNTVQVDLWLKLCKKGFLSTGKN